MPTPRWEGGMGNVEANPERLPFHFRIPHSDFRIRSKIIVES